MPTEVLHVAVHVAEPKAGDYRWVLTKLAPDHSWIEAGRAEAAATTFKQALAEGCLALEELLSGSPGEDSEREQPEDAADSKRRRTAFGFGLAS